MAQLQNAENLQGSENKKQRNRNAQSEKFIGTFTPKKDYDLMRVRKTLRTRFTQKITEDGHIKALIEVDYMTRASTLETPIFLGTRDT